MRDLVDAVWTPLQPNPLLWLTLTIGAYVLGLRIQRRCNDSPLANPVLIAILVIIPILRITHTTYASYFSGARFIHMLLGPATVALAVPLARHLPQVRRVPMGVALSLLAGSLTSIVSGIAIVRLFGGTRDVMLSIAPKAATTPIAMPIADEIGGIPALTATMAIAGGIVAAICVQATLRRLRIRDWRVQGFAAGVSGSGLAAARVAPLHSLAAAFAALGIGLNGLLTAMIVPLVVRIWS